MEQNKFKKCSLTLICFFIISGCQIDLIETRNISLNKIEFGSSVNDSFRKKSLKYFTQDKSKDNYNLKISKLQFKKKNFYKAIYDYQQRERRFGKTSEQILNHNA